MLLWAASGAVLTLLALRAARAGSRPSDDGERRSALDVAIWGLATPPPLERDDPRGDLEVAVLTILTLLVTPIVWPHYYVVLVMPVAVLAIVPRAAGARRLGALDGRDRRGPLQDAAVVASRPRARTAPAAPYDRRRRVLPLLALVLVALATAVLSTAHYVEPFRGVGGQQLVMLLALFGASLVALAWSARDQGRGARPEAVRYSAI